MSEEEALRTLKLIIFSGKHEDWDEWSEKFQCIAVKRAYLEVLVGAVSSPQDGTRLSTDEERAKRKRNSDGYSDLMMSTTELAFKNVLRAQNSQFERRKLEESLE
jgi:hypothetical protein